MCSSYNGEKNEDTVKYTNVHESVSKHRGTWDGGRPRQAGTMVTPVIGCAGAKEKCRWR